ncbi:protein kinase [Algoriphagus sp. SE2]|uniref:protein kinase domain-containing protein n=1 Tax=Algoriphagus sp. SE2 TaxID=3141536 RepID=UPI0031CDA7B7
MINRIFINYRKADSEPEVNWLYEKLKNAFNQEKIFMDSGSLERGANWPDTIRQKLLESEIVLVVIGENWLTVGTDNFGRRRIDQENDWVRIEIELAFDQDKIVFPILLNGAQMPPTEALPKSISKLSHIQAKRLDINSSKPEEIKEFVKDLSTTLAKRKSPDKLRESLEKILVDKYEIKKFIAKGAISNVYLAHDTGLERKVAIKAIENPEFNNLITETLKEAVKFDALVTNSIHIYGAWLDRDPYHIVTNYLEKGTLRSLIDETEGRGLDLKEAHKLMLEMSETIEKAHSVGITHCNIKPSNILFNDIKVPFISALCRLPKITQSTILKKLALRKSEIHNPGYREDLCYLAPEIFDQTYREEEQKRLKKIDQYMLGLMGYELLTGQIPHTVSTIEDIESQGHRAFNKLVEVSNFRKDCPNKLSEIISRMVETDPAKRYPSLNLAVSEIKSITLDSIEIAKDSFNRCMTTTHLEKSFFQTFYGELIRLSNEAADRFSGQDLGRSKHHKQYDLLREAIFILLMFAEKKLGDKEPNILTRIAQMHNKKNYDISWPSYDQFVEALINTVCGHPTYVPKPYDQECQLNENEREMIENAWREAIEPGISYMKNAYFL